MKPYGINHKWRILHFSWLAFCCTFIAWFSFAPLSILIQKDLGLTNVQLGWLATAGVALTIPGRLLVGWLVDLMGPRKSFSVLLAVMAIPVLMMSLVQSFSQLLVLRLLAGLTGCGFVIGIRLLADWFSPRQLGLVEGIYGGWGNAGSGIAAVCLPIIAANYGWRAALAASAVPMLVWSVIFWCGVSDVPAGQVFRRAPREVKFSALKDRRAIILAIAYFATFGSELCVVAFLPKYFFDKFHLSAMAAGMLASVFGLANIAARPIGGWLADIAGRRRVLLCMLGASAVAYLAIATAPTLPLAIVAVVVASFVVQAGAGAVFAIVPLISHTHTGRVAGLVGAAGNVGGVLFPLVFGYGLLWTGGSYLPGFIGVAVGALLGFTAVLALKVPESHHDETEALIPETTANHGARVQARPVYEPKRRLQAIPQQLAGDLL
jgi:NNP family nitrate/nitrite transporter-like MFS transporter